MNSVNYAYNTHDASTVVVNRIYYLMNMHGWSIKTLSEQSNIPYETLKKLLSRKIEGTSMHNMVKIASAFHCRIDYLMGLDNLIEEETLSSNLYKNILKYVKEIDRSLNNCSTYSEGAFIPVHSPDSILRGSKLPSSCNIDLLDISSYPALLQDTICCGIKLDSHCYHPIFNKEDVALIAQDRMPFSGETAVFMHNGYLYIRKFISYSDQIILEPVNAVGKPICLSELTEWFIFGYVVGVHRPRKS